MHWWKTSTADTKFSELVRQRDKKCVRCQSTQNLQCSHFFNIGNATTRFDLDNADTLCYPCHFGQVKTGWEYHKQCCYLKFKLDQLGCERFNKLRDKAHSIGSLEKERKKFQLSLTPKK